MMKSRVMFIDVPSRSDGMLYRAWLAIHAGRARLFDARRPPPTRLPIGCKDVGRALAVMFVRIT
jgi:hypothetical protein